MTRVPIVTRLLPAGNRVRVVLLHCQVARDRNSRRTRRLPPNLQVLNHLSHCDLGDERYVRHPPWFCQPSTLSCCVDLVVVVGIMNAGSDSSEDWQIYADKSVRVTCHAQENGNLMTVITAPTWKNKSRWTCASYGRSGCPLTTRRRIRSASIVNAQPISRSGKPSLAAGGVAHSDSLHTLPPHRRRERRSPSACRL